MVYSRAPLKGIYEAVKFVEWLNHSKNIQAKLTIIGFNGNLPPNAPTDFKSTVLHNDLVAVLGDFEEYGHVQKMCYYPLTSICAYREQTHVLMLLLNACLSDFPSLD